MPSPRRRDVPFLLLLALVAAFAVGAGAEAGGREVVATRVVGGATIELAAPDAAERLLLDELRARFASLFAGAWDVEVAASKTTTREDATGDVAVAFRSTTARLFLDGERFRFAAQVVTHDPAGEVAHEDHLLLFDGEAVAAHVRRLPEDASGAAPMPVSTLHESPRRLADGRAAIDPRHQEWFPPALLAGPVQGEYTWFVDLAASTEASVGFVAVSPREGIDTARTLTRIEVERGTGRMRHATMIRTATGAPIVATSYAYDEADPARPWLPSSLASVDRAARGVTDETELTFVGFAPVPLAEAEALRADPATFSLLPTWDEPFFTQVRMPVDGGEPEVVRYLRRDEGPGS